MVSTTNKIKDALLGRHSDSTADSSNREHHTTTSTTTETNTTKQPQVAVAGRTAPVNDATTSPTLTADTVTTTDGGARNMAGVAKPTTAVQQTTAPAGTSWRHESHVLTNTMSGLQATPQVPNVNVNEIYKDYLPHRNAAWIQQLIQQMDSTSRDIDCYAKQQQELISREAASEVEKIMHCNKAKQDALIASMHRRANEFEHEYSRKREAVIKQLDREESLLLEQLQQQLKAEQQQIAAETKAAVERIAELARERKLQVLGEAQSKHDQLSSNLNTTTQTNVDPTSLTKHHLYGNEKNAGNDATEVRSEDADMTIGEPRVANITTTQQQTEQV